MASADAVAVPETEPGYPEPDPLGGASAYRAAVQVPVPAVRGRLADYAAMPVLGVLREVASAPRGLTEDEAQERLARHGENTLPGVRPSHWSRRPLSAARDPFILLLIGLDAVSAITGDLGGTVLIAAAVVVGCLLRFGQERRGVRAGAALRAMVATTATVLRRAAPGSAPMAREVPVDQIVPGDVVALAPGDVVPADLRLLAATDLGIAQAALSGESLPCAKWAPAADHPPRSLGDHGGEGGMFDCPWLCFMGSTVVAGTGTGVVVATGASTYFAASRHDLPRRTAETTFERGMRNLSRALVAFMLVLVPAVLALHLIVRHSGLGAVLLAISVAVGLTPEMLPVVVTSAMVRGARTLAGRGVIVKRLPALHNLGAMRVLCVDKTGTLTEDRPRVVLHVDPLGRPDDEVLRRACVNSLLAAEAAAVMDAVDEALLTYAAEAGIPVGGGAPAVGVIPFDSVRRRGTAVVRGGGLGAHTLVTKGAVEDVLECCVRLRTDGGDVPLDAAWRRRLARLTERHARDGVRLLAVAVAERPAVGRRYRPGDEHDLTLVGFIGMQDQPKPSARAALAALADHGVAVKVVTGDHPGVAAAVCRQAGLEPGRIVVGREVERLDDAALAELADATAVFARVTPEQKARIVRVLRHDRRQDRRHGHVHDRDHRHDHRSVGFLGDGVNDTAALRAADVGVSVRNAVPAARESADVILAGKDLTALVGAVVAGRRTFGNVVKYLSITVSSNAGNAASMLAAVLLLPFLPMLPLQVLVQNLCFDLSQLALAFDRVDEAPLRVPRTFDLRGLARFVLWFGLLNTLADLATFALLRHVTDGSDQPAARMLFHTGWFAENLLTQALAVHLLRSRFAPGLRRRAAVPVLAATAALAALALLLPYSPLASPLAMHPPPVEYFWWLAAVLAAYVAVTLAAKAAYLRRTADW